MSAAVAKRGHPRFFNTPLRLHTVILADVGAEVISPLDAEEGEIRGKLRSKSEVGRPLRLGNRLAGHPARLTCLARCGVLNLNYGLQQRINLFPPRTSPLETVLLMPRLKVWQFWRG